jgi:hypothetical protein
MTLFLDIVVVAAAALLAVAAMLTLRRRAQPGGAFADSDRASGVFGLLGTGFAIFLGFVIFLAFADYEKAKQASSDEAEATLQQFENAHLFDAAGAHALEGQLICYGRAVVHQGWPLMERDKTASPVVDHWSIGIQRVGDTVTVTGAKADAAYQTFLDQNEQRSENRNARLLEARHPIPSLLWLLVVVAGAFVIGFMLLYADPDELVRAQAMIAASVTAVVVAGILLVIFLNSPYGSGDGTIKPVAMEHSLSLMESQFSGAPPCTPDGLPRRA